MVDIARRTGKRVFENFAEIPRIEADSMEEGK
jgi:hypothetical protein